MRPRPRLRPRSRRWWTGGDLLIDRDPGTGLGDVVLGAKLDLKRKAGPLLLAVEGQVKLPTGDEDSLYSSGDDVLFLFTDHIGLTRDPVFADNVLFWLLEDSRRLR